jgi:DegV family protein with EDD domain
MSKTKVAIVTDSTAYLPADLVDQYNIHVIPLVLCWEEEDLLDGVDITPTAFYERLKNSGIIPTTSQPSPGKFVEFFTQIAETAESIVAIFISDELSGTLDSAHTATDMMPDYPIEIVDSRSTSMGLGLIVLAAAREAERGQDHVEVANVARAIVPKTRVLFVVDTLEYLHKGGRIGGAKRLFGSLLSIKPVLHLVDGRIEPLASIRTKSKAIKHMLAVADQEVVGNKPVHVGVFNALAPQEAKNIYKTIYTLIRPEELIQAELSPVIGTHVGPGTVGIAYYSGITQ